MNSRTGVIGEDGEIKCAHCSKTFDAARNRKGSVNVSAEQIMPPGKGAGLSSSITSGAYDCPHCQKRTMVREQP